LTEEQVEALEEAFKAIIDSRLTELNVITKKHKAPIVDEDEEEPAKPAKPAKGKKNKKVVEPEHDFDEVKKKLVEFIDAKDKQQAVDALSRFGVKKLTDLSKDQYDEFYEYLDNKMENGEDPSDAEELFGGDE
jgi:hypothetical protein